MSPEAVRANLERIRGEVGSAVTIVAATKYVAPEDMRDLLEAGVHFGHQTRRWNPKMKRFIFTERGGIYIIDLQQTMGLLHEAFTYVGNVGERNGTVLFVGTKKQAQDAVAEHAGRVGMVILVNLLLPWEAVHSVLNIALILTMPEHRGEARHGTGDRRFP